MFCVSVRYFTSVYCDHISSVTNRHSLIAFSPWWPSIVEEKGQTSPSDERYISGASAEALIHITTCGIDISVIWSQKCRSSVKALIGLLTRGTNSLAEIDNKKKKIVVENTHSKLSVFSEAAPLASRCFYTVILRNALCLFRQVWLIEHYAFTTHPYLLKQ